MSEMQELLSLPLMDLVNITVTTQKRREKSQEVAAAVSAIDSTRLYSWDVRDVMRLGIVTPGLVVGRTGYDPRPALRGVRTQQVEHNDTAISVYQNGIYRPRHAQSMMPFLDLNRVEVMRGPQGTLFGRNSFGGTIEYVTNIPELQQNYGDIQLALGNYKHQLLQSVGNISISSNHALRLSLLTEQHDPYVENTYREDAGIRDKDASLIRLQFLSQLSSRSSFLISYDRWREDSNGYGIFGSKVLGIPIDLSSNTTNPSAEVFPRLGRDDICTSSCGRYGAGLDIRSSPGLDGTVFVEPHPYRIASDFQSQQIIEEDIFSAELDYSFDAFDIKFLASDSKFSDFRIEDADFSFYSSVLEGYDLNSKSESFELQLLSRDGLSFEWVAGLYYFYEHLDYAFLWQDLVDLSDNRPALGAEPKNEWASWMSQLHMHTSSKAIYGQGRYFFTDKWRGIVGARFTVDDRHWTILGQDSDNLQQRSFNLPLVSNAKDDWQDLTWRGGIEYQWRDESLLYMTLSTGFLAGNFKVDDKSYDEQKVTAYELGSKNIFYDDKIRLNLSLYVNDYKDLLSTDFVDTEGTTVGIVKNSGNIRASGLELELDYFPNERWMLALRGEYSHARYGRFIVGNPYQSGGQSISGVDNLFSLKGDQVALSPDYTLSLLSHYTVSLGKLGTLTPSIVSYWSDEYRTSDEPYKYGVQDDYIVTDIFLKWESQKRNIDASLFVKNISDEEILLRSTRFGGNVAVVEYADPRTFGINFRFKISRDSITRSRP